MVASLNNIRLGAYETFDGDLKTINVPLGTGYIVKSFVWTDNYTPLMESIHLQ